MLFLIQYDTLLLLLVVLTHCLRHRTSSLTDLEMELDRPSVSRRRYLDQSRLGAALAATDIDAWPNAATA